MSFRIEEKINIHKNNSIFLKNWLSENNAKVLFPPRIISSIYFDNDNFEMYHNSIEGVLPRKKIRIRYYPENKDKIFYLEKKISTTEGRFKTKEKVKFSLKKINEKIYDNNYGECNSKLIVNYRREYYFLMNTRVTIDSNINFSQIFNNKILKKKFFLNKLAMELKNNINYSKDKLLDDFPFEVIRFSKYCEAIIALKYV